MNKEMPNYDLPDPIPLVEPIKRLDGKIVTICEIPSGNIVLSVNGLAAQYSRDEVNLLGNGDFDMGLVKLGQEAYNEQELQPQWGKPRWLSDQIKELSS